MYVTTLARKEPYSILCRICTYGHEVSLSVIFRPNSAPAGYLSDLFEFNPNKNTWRNFTFAVNGVLPIPSGSHGFIVSDQRLYVHGGVDIFGMKI